MNDENQGTLSKPMQLVMMALMNLKPIVNRDFEEVKEFLKEDDPAELSLEKMFRIMTNSYGYFEEESLRESAYSDFLKVTCSLKPIPGKRRMW